MKKYKIRAKKIKELEIVVEADNEEKAMDKVNEFIDQLDIFELDIPSLISEYYEIEPSDLEENDEEIDSIFEEIECNLCKYYCDKCGSCLLKNNIL